MLFSGEISSTLLEGVIRHMCIQFLLLSPYVNKICREGERDKMELIK